MFEKCKEFGISLNPEKCLFLVFSGIILGVHSFQGGEVNGPKETQGNCKIATPLPHHMGFRLLMG
jgi:hypothetical protein